MMHPLATEKSVGLIERSNVITYMVDYRATKPEIKKEFERIFGVKVARIRTLTTPTNGKKAFIKLAEGYSAGDVALKLKIA